MMSRLLLLIVFVTSLFAQSPDNRWNKATYITLEPSPAVTLRKGKAAKATVRFRVNKGFHVNSNKPSSDLLIPTEVKFEASPAVAVGKLEYPVGEEFALSFSPGEKLSVYQGDVAVNVPLTVAKTTKPGDYTLKGSLSYQACNDSACFPPKAELFELKVRVR